MVHLEIFPDDHWADAVAARLLARLQSITRLCLATGSTPTPIYARVADTAALHDLTVFLLDEFGGLPEGDPGRCFSMLSRDLLESSPGPTVHVPDVDASDPEEAANHYRTLISQGGIDLAIVGLGANGHIGMNEPGSTPDSATRVVTLDHATSQNAMGYGASTPPTWGITVGLRELMDAREVWLLATGSHKSAILERTLSGPVDSDVPATFLTEHHNCIFYIDESAALTWSA